MSLIQIILAVFILFALSRVILRFRSSQLSPLEFAFWIILFLLAILGVSFPSELSQISNFFGVGRAVDLAIYISVVVLFYLVFRIYILLEDVRHEITEVVRQIALKSRKKK